MLSYASHLFLSLLHGTGTEIAVLKNEKRVSIVVFTKKCYKNMMSAYTVMSLVCAPQSIHSWEGFLQLLFTLWNNWRHEPIGPDSNLSNEVMLRPRIDTALELLEKVKTAFKCSWMQLAVLILNCEGLMAQVTKSVQWMSEPVSTTEMNQET